MSLPTIVLIPGAWHTPEHYASLTTHLQSQNHPVISSRLPSVGSATPLEESVAKDTAFIRDTLLLPSITAGKDVLLLMHSYGGCPGAAAAKGLSRQERSAAGLRGGIVGMVFMCAFVAAEGDSVKGKIPGGEYDAWVVEDKATAQLTVDNPASVFYNDVDAASAARAAALLLPHAEPALSTPSGAPAWPDAAYDGKRAYIQAELDACVPFAAQEAIVKYSGVQWDVLKLRAGHSPFLSCTEEVVGFVVGKAGEWAA